MQPVREVYSLLMPVRDGRIIVPRAAVAEVMGYTKPKDRPEGAPAFVLGFIEWQGQRIPLVSFEAARGQDVPELGRRTRIAVVFGIAGRLRPDVFAVITQGYPYLVRVNENVLQREEMEAEDPLVLARVRMANEKPLIPNLEKLEALLADCLGAGPGSEESAATEQPVDELDAMNVGSEEEFVAAIAEDDDQETDAEADGVGTPDIDLGEITSVGTETSYSSEMDELSEVLNDSNGDTDREEADASDVDLGEVTAFGVETDYSAELDELSGALQGEGDAGDSETPDDDDGFDLSGLELDEADDTVPAPDKSKDDDAGEIDISDLEFDLDDDEDDGKG